jgi:hypothetical protein
MAELHLRAGDTSLAQASLDRAETIFGQLGAAGWQAKVEGFRQLLSK